MKIYTKRGDEGTTSMYGGGNYWKDNPRIEAYGTIDELNSFLGLLVSNNTISDQHRVLQQVQHTLFDIGANLATHPRMSPPMDPVKDTDISTLEDQIDIMTAVLPPLKHFILPGGDAPTAQCHISRTICRRAERRLVHLQREEEIDPNAIRYLNRLSDYLFVLARMTAHQNGSEEVQWSGKTGS